jgi:transcriptional regulator with PAS, ATPase and Fis domain
MLICAGSANPEVPAGDPLLWPLSEERPIGRATAASPACQLDPGLSRRHALVGRAPGGVHWVCDLDSTNGTWLNGVRLPPRVQQRLSPGSVLMMGGRIFVFRSMTAEQIESLRQEQETPFAPVATASPVLALLLHRLRRLAPANVELLLTGETGVGKEVHARAIHHRSGRAGPFLAINCAAIPENLIESELFGYQRGAHSTAERAKPGLLEQAQGGTVFLDEIGEMPPAAQSKLLRFLQTREVQSLGSTRPQILDVRIIAATHQPVASPGEDRGLRFDLAARLGPEPIALPALRDRPEDIGALIRHFVGPAIAFTPEAFLALFLHNWRGNVRELEKVLTVARLLTDEDESIDLPHLPGEIATRVEASGNAPSRRRRPTREELVALLSRHGGDVARVAREMGRQRTLVWRWVREASVRLDDYR